MWKLSKLAVFLLLFAVLMFMTTPVIAQCYCPSVIYYSTPIYSTPVYSYVSPVYAYPHVYVSPPSVVYVDSPVRVYPAPTIRSHSAVVVDLDELPSASVASSEPQPERIWHPARWERVRVTYWVKEWQQAQWVNDGPDRQVLQEGKWIRVRKTGWEEVYKEGYYTYVYPDKSIERSVDKVANR
jgi:hypothetical protein